MQQFPTHRFWANVLATCLAIGLWSATPDLARAGSEYGIDGNPDLRNPSSPPPPQGTGDPDMPSGAPRSSGRSGIKRGDMGSLRGQLAPNGALTAQEVWTLRLWVTLRSLRSLTLR